jgi:hypothetical protein
VFFDSSSSTGVIRVFYDPILSKKGALLSSAKPAKREMQASDFAVVGEIINPHALPLFRVSYLILALIPLSETDLEMLDYK